MFGAAIFVKILSFFKNFRPSVTQIIIAILIILHGVQYVRINGLRIAPHIAFIKFTLIDIEGYENKVKRLEADNKKIIDKGKENHNLQIKINSQPRIVSQRAAEATNEISEKSQKEFDIAVKNYASAHFVRRCNSVPSRTESVLDGKAGLPGTDSAAQSSDQKDLDTSMVSIPTSDFEYYNQNTKDLRELREIFFKTMIDAGVFISFDDASKDSRFFKSEESVDSENK